jgi:CubicO group peptidase (beta-lactamase class C family)
MSGLSRETRGNMKSGLILSKAPDPLPFPTLKELIEGLSKYPFVAPTYSYPVYSNAGTAMLGVATVAANAAFEKERGAAESPSTWQALAQRDIFDSLGLNGSYFVVTPEDTAHVVVSSRSRHEVVSQ